MQLMLKTELVLNYIEKAKFCSIDEKMKLDYCWLEHVVKANEREKEVAIPLRKSQNDTKTDFCTVTAFQTPETQKLTSRMMHDTFLD